jgi:CheY-like chemotaxis protein
MSYSLTHRRILLVEDQSDLRFILALALAALDREIIPAIHGADALRLFKDYDGKFDAVITDYEMPTMDGLGLVQSLREIKFQGKIIVMSGNMPPEKLKIFQQYDIDGFLRKPFEIDALTEMLNGKG